MERDSFHNQFGVAQFDTMQNIRPLRVTPTQKKTSGADVTPVTPSGGYKS